jgi:YbbR domain-containing protein
VIRLSILTHNWAWKLVSLAAAIVIWYTTARDPELVSFVSVPVQYNRLPGDFEISSDAVEQVNLELQGSSGMLRRLSESKPNVVLNFAGVASSGTRTFNIDEHAVSLPHGIRLVRAIPSQLQFDFEKRATVKVPIEAVFSGKLQPRYQLLRYETNPPEVVLEGPENRLRPVTAVKTDSIDLTQIVGTAEFRVNTLAPDPHIRFQGPARVVVRVFVEKR